MNRKELKRLLTIEGYYQSKNPIKNWWNRQRDASLDAIVLLRQYQYHASNKHRFGAVLIKRKLIRRYGIFVDRNTVIGEGLKLPHPNGIIIGKGVTIGKNCRIFQQVTIGSKNNEDSLKGMQPRLGDGCTLFAGCKVIGQIQLSDGTTVGANAVLMTDTEKDTTYVGSPARKIEKKR